MRYQSVVLIWLLSAGCQSEIEAYISEHTQVNIIYGDNPSVEVFAENNQDLKPDITLDLLWVQRTIKNTVLSDNGLDYFRLFIPLSDESYRNISETLSFSDEDWGNPRALTCAERRIIVYNPDIWRNKSRNRIVRTYIHEIMHYVALKIDGDPDSTHQRKEYWDKYGLVSQVYSDFLETHP